MMSSMGEPRAELLWGRAEDLERLGDVEGASALYASASASGAEPPTARSALRHAEHLERRGDWEAERHFRRAAQDPDPALSARGWRGIAALEAARGNQPAALQALRSIIDTGDVDEMPRALRNMGVMLDDAGEIDAAREAYERAIATHHQQQAPAAMVNLAQLDEKVGDLDCARSGFEQAIATDHPVESQRARVLLGFLHQAQGDNDRAFACFEAVDGDPGDEWVQRAAMHAGAMLLDRGDHAAAAPRLRIASGLEIPEEAAVPAFFLALAEAALGNLEAARTAFEFAGANGTGDVRDAAAERLRGLGSGGSSAASKGDGRELLERSRILVEPLSRAALDAILADDEHLLRVADGSLMVWPNTDHEPGVIVLTSTRVVFVPEAKRRLLGGVKQPEAQSYAVGNIGQLRSLAGMLHIARSDRNEPQFGDWLLNVGNRDVTQDLAMAIIASSTYRGSR